MTHDSPSIPAVIAYLRGLHDRITDELESVDGAGRFRRDTWQRPEGGGGESRVLREGAVFEQAGINFSHVLGGKLPASATAQRPELAGASFEATGVSLVIHPRNPYVPTSHANVRFFVAFQDGAPSAWWFGGGFDLTPVYPFDEDVRCWHEAARAACAPAGPHAYPILKDTCDKYFWLPHRGETRGVGGLFVDDLNDVAADVGGSFEHCFALIRRIGDTYLETYSELVRRRRDTPFGQREQDFQRLRRGRYVEFNLAFDRGTRFGLKSQARTESLLMSLPPRAEWRYDYRPEPGSAEARLHTEFLPTRDWCQE